LRTCATRFFLLPCDGSNIYFHSYIFTQPELQAIRVQQAKVGEVHFRCDSFNDFANKLKHVDPWVGLRQVREDGIIDIYDQEGVGLVFGAIDIVHKAADKILSILTELV